MIQFKTCTAIVLATGVVGAANAAGSYVLEDLILQGGTVTVGDKLFSDFTYNFTGDMPDASDVNVIAITDDLGNFGLRFQGAFLDLPGNAGSDALITYNVTVTDPNFEIIGARMQGNPAVLGGGNSFAGVTDSFLPQVNNQTLVIFDSNGQVELDNSVFFDQGFSTLSVQKDIILLTDDDAVATTISFIDQTYYQIPEPGSIALLGLGGLALLRRRR